MKDFSLQPKGRLGNLYLFVEGLSLTGHLVQQSVEVVLVDVGAVRELFERKHVVQVKVPLVGLRDADLTRFDG